MDPLWTHYGPAMDPLWTHYGPPVFHPSSTTMVGAPLPPLHPVFHLYGHPSSTPSSTSMDPRLPPVFHPSSTTMDGALLAGPPVFHPSSTTMDGARLDLLWTLSVPVWTSYGPPSSTRLPPPSSTPVFHLVFHPRLWPAYLQSSRSTSLCAMERPPRSGTGRPSKRSKQGVQ